jgi:hypothetical protein
MIREGGEGWSDAEGGDRNIYVGRGGNIRVVMRKKVSKRGRERESK